MKYKIGDELDVSIKKIVPNGLGMAFAEKLTVFVPLSAIGDELRVEIRDIKGKVAFARILEVKVESSDRVEPECEYYGKCGGCDLQHISYEAQLAAKREIILDCFTRIGKISLEEDITMIGCPETLRYRMRAQWHADTQKKILGYFGRQSHNVVDTETCPILLPELESKMKTLRQALDEGVFLEDLIDVEAAIGSDDKTSIYAVELMEATKEIHCEALGNRYIFNARSFFQGNRIMIEPLINAAIGELEGNSALDLYCGVGLFSIPLADRFEKVKGIEDNQRSIEFAKKNGVLARKENIEFQNGRVKNRLNEAIENKEYFDLVLLDPPRSGAKSGVISQIKRLAPRKVSYVSCNPATLARDLKDLQEHGYSIDSVTGLDMFPQTHHIETIVQLSLLK